MNKIKVLSKGYNVHIKSQTGGYYNEYEVNLVFENIEEVRTLINFLRFLSENNYLDIYDDYEDERKFIDDVESYFMNDAYFVQEIEKYFTNENYCKEDDYFYGGAYYRHITNKLLGSDSDWQTRDFDTCIITYIEEDIYAPKIEI